MGQPTPLIWSNDDIQYGNSAQLQRMLAFLDSHGIPGSFFLIPRVKDHTLADDPDLLRTIDDARARGHTFHQHGYIHTPFESGVPTTWTLDFAPDVRRQYDDDRLEIEKGHTLEALVTMIDNGRRIWRRAFGEESDGYRPGWGAMCGNLYRALETLSFTWVSSHLTSRTSWLWNQGLWDAPIEWLDDARLGPHRIGQLLEIPIAGDYAFRVRNNPAHIDAMVRLAVTEFERYHARGLPMTMVSHWSGLERDNHAGYTIHDRLLRELLATGMAEPMSITQLVERTHASASQLVESHP